MNPLSEIEHLDVVVVGAGISGISAGYHLQTLSPDRSYTILEGRDSLGGTWDLFRYPGVRSDSDMHTLGFAFKPWTDPKSIAGGPAILDYLRETATEFGIDQHIQFGHRLTAAEWSSSDARWTLTVSRDSGDSITITCGFLFMCSGYYRYASGHDPEFAGRDDFGGRIVHPQRWPDDLDYTDERVVVIGSGATAVTLVPAMASEAAHVTMLQRSPTWVVSGPDHDIIANSLRRVLPERLAYRLVRAKNIWLSQFVYRRTRTHPASMRKRLLNMVRKEVGDDFDVDTHFTPDYNPWDQRLCLVPNGDLFAAIRSGQASVVTDYIERFDHDGIVLTSGERIDADIIVTATGLELVTLGEVQFRIDGVPVDFAERFTYKGFAYSDVPNLASSFGYVNASWTLRADMISDYVCRILNHLRDTDTAIATPHLRSSDRNMVARPWIEDFSAGYIQRVLPLLPKQGDREPWLNTQSHTADTRLIADAPVADGVMTFSHPEGSHPEHLDAPESPVAAGGKIHA